MPIISPDIGTTALGSTTGALAVTGPVQGGTHPTRVLHRTHLSSLPSRFLAAAAAASLQFAGRTNRGFARHPTIDALIIR